MKKTLILLLALSLLLCGCGTEEAVSTDAPADAPQITEAAQIPDDQEAVTKPPAQTDTITVTRQVRMAALNEDGTERWYREYTYDELGRLATEREIISDTGEQTYFAAVSYTDTGSGVEMLYTYPEGNTMTIRETLDDRGNVILREDIHDGYVDYYTEYTYDEAGNLISEETHYSEDPGVPRNEYDYDERGNQIAHRTYSDEELTGRLETEYDADGRQSSSVYYDANGELVSSTVSTWDGNTETRTRFDSSDEAYMEIIITYDAEGNILRQETQQEGYIISCTEYTYERIEIPAP